MITKTTKSAAPATLDLGALAAPASKKAKKEKVYPFATASALSVQLADRFIMLHAKAKAYNGALETTKAQLRSLVVEDFFAANSGQYEPSSSIVVKGSGDNEVMLPFTNSYRTASVEDIEAVVPAEVRDAHFAQKLAVKVKAEILPVQKKQALLAGLAALAQELGISNPTDLFEASVIYAPTESFHAARHVALTPEENVAVHDVLACTIQVKVRNSTPLSAEAAAALAAEVEKCDAIVKEGEAEGFGESTKAKSIAATKTAARKTNNRAKAVTARKALAAK